MSTVLCLKSCMNSPNELTHACASCTHIQLASRANPLEAAATGSQYLRSAHMHHTKAL